MLLVRWSTRRNIEQVGLTSLVNGVHDPLALAIRGGNNILQKKFHADPDRRLTDQFGAVFISDLKNRGENQIEDPAMHLHSRFKAFHFQTWIEANQQLLKPPVGNKLVFENTGMVVQVVGGPNQRVDFHDDPVEEFFYQLRGDIILKIAEGGKIYDVPIREGEVFMLPPHVRHSPQRPMAGSVGLVVEGTRRVEDRDGFEWYCFNCGEKVHRIEITVTNIVKDLPPLYERFYASQKLRTCPTCGTVHPGKNPPGGWVAI